MSEPRRFYGWTLLAVAWLAYGLGISPGFYTWGLLMRESAGMAVDLDLSATRQGLVFSVFQYAYHFTGPLTALIIGRWGLRVTMTGGSMMAALGFLWLGYSRHWLESLLAFGLVVGIGVGLSVFVPTQTLIANWFDRYRARSMAILLTAGGLIGTAVHWMYEGLVGVVGWRGIWIVIAAISGVVTLLCAAFVRTKPEDLGQEIDGGAGPIDRPEEATTPKRDPPREEWPASQAIRSPQFLIVCTASIAFGVPWGTLTVFLPRLLEIHGFAPALATGILSIRVLISTGGRFFGSAGDFMAPQRVLGLALVLEALGTAGLLFAHTSALAYLGAGLVGMGFGAAYVSVPVVLATFFGRRSFAAVNGVQFVVRGIVTPAVPVLFGIVVDATGSYQWSVLGVAGLTLLGATVAFFAKAPVRLSTAARA